MIENLITGTVFFYDHFFSSIFFFNLFDIFGLYMSYEAQIYFKIVFQISSRLFPPKPPTWPTMHSPSNIGINYCMVYLSKFAVSYEKRKYILEGGRI